MVKKKSKKSKKSNQELDPNEWILHVKYFDEDIELIIPNDATLALVKHRLLGLFGDEIDESCFDVKFPAGSEPEALSNGEIGDHDKLIDFNVKEHPHVVFHGKPYTYNETIDHIERIRQVCGFRKPYPLPVLDAGLTSFAILEKKLDAVSAKNEKMKKPDPQILKEYEKDFQAACKKFGRFSPGRKWSPPVTAVHTLQLSQWNPPPPALKFEDHIAYLYLVTIENFKYHIACTRAGFYVCNNTDTKFDPSPKKMDSSSKKNDNRDTPCHSLMKLIEQVSPGFLNQIERLKSYADEFGYLNHVQPTGSFLAAPWLVSNSRDWTADMTRCQIGLGETSEYRDWSDYLQSARDASFEDEKMDKLISPYFPNLAKDRLLYSSTFEFTQAAIKGAIDIINGNVDPLNPDEKYPAHIYLHQGIFYSYPNDLSHYFDGFGGNSAARYCASKDVAAINCLDEMQSDGTRTLWTVIVDYYGKRIICQSPLPGIFDDSDESGKIVYGSVDDRQSVVTDAKYDAGMKKIADHFLLKKHQVWGADGSSVQVEASVEMKGINGNDGHQYILDLYRCTPPDLVFLEKYFEMDDEDSESSAYPHAVATLRIEAIRSWIFDKLGETEDPTLKEEMSPTDRMAFVKEFYQNFKLNPDVGFIDEQYCPADHRQQFEKDREEVREVCRYITDDLVPKFIAEIKSGLVNSPIDGENLTTSMHTRGINMRYLGFIHDSVKHDPDLRELSIIVQQEAIARTVKYLMRFIMPGETAQYSISTNILNMLKELFGPESKIKPKIHAYAFKRFRLHIEESYWRESSYKMSLLREVCMKLGLQMANKKYNLDSREPFKPGDLVNIVPIVKGVSCNTQLGRNVMATAQRLSEEGDNKSAIPLAESSLNIDQQIYGPIHADIARAYMSIAFMCSEDKNYEKACEMTRRAIIIMERIDGVDSSYAFLAKGNLVTFEFCAGNPAGALLILEDMLTYNYMFPGQMKNPQILSIIAHIGAMLDGMDLKEDSVKWYTISRDTIVRVFGDRSLAAGSAHYKLSQALIKAGRLHDATNDMLRSHHVYKSLYGDDHEETKEIKRWMDVLLPSLINEQRLGNQRVIRDRGEGSSGGVQGEVSSGEEVRGGREGDHGEGSSKDHGEGSSKHFVEELHDADEESKNSDESMNSMSSKRRAKKKNKRKR